MFGGTSVFNGTIHTLTLVTGYVKNRFIIDIAAGDNHGLALSSYGEVFAFGSNAYGQLGDATLQSKSTPVPVLGSLAYKVTIAVDASTVTSYALTSDGQVYSWGNNTFGKLGIGISGGLRATPSLVQGLNDVFITSISAGATHMLAVSSNGSAYSWGLNNYGELGDQTTTTRYSPVQVISTLPSSLYFAAASAGSSHSLFIMNSTYCSGLYSDDPMACTWRGTCVTHDTCACYTGYHGNNCELTTCLYVNK
jgi:alpha-tubulin suppressor-like RCC1 family protein